MTTIKIDSKVSAAVEAALEDRADEIFDDLGGHWTAVIEVRAVERTQPAPDEEGKDRAVKVRIVGLELAGDELEDERLRRQRSEMKRRRTSGGTLDSVAV
ncbi:hypothetical protein [Streptomyces sp. WAC 06725]|uniref:hypothetical protein n=1 Tax=Streptomyces sp. WAC 06725 TaxID=2203209 RepID=UPI0021ADDE18|nr:hypothetical protein [Streptomyces sp. WAC 06725]